MEHERNYEVIITHEGILVFLIKTRYTSPDKPFILYDGGKHATLYRKDDETILLDYLNEKVIPILSKAQKAIIFELSDEIEDVSLHFNNTKILQATFSSACIVDFKKNVKHIKNNAFAANVGEKD